MEYFLAFLIMVISAGILFFAQKFLGVEVAFFLQVFITLAALIVARMITASRRKE